jgi:hypothetical protein
VLALFVHLRKTTIALLSLIRILAVVCHIKTSSWSLDINFRLPS